VGSFHHGQTIVRTAGFIPCLFPDVVWLSAYLSPSCRARSLALVERVGDSRQLHSRNIPLTRDFAIARGSVCAMLNAQFSKQPKIGHCLAKRSNPFRRTQKEWISSSLCPRQIDGARQHFRRSRPGAFSPASFAIDVRPPIRGRQECRRRWRAHPPRVG